MGINIQSIYSGVSAQIKNFLLKSLPGSNLKVVDLDLSTKWAKTAQNARFEATPGAVDKRAPVSYYNSSAISANPISGLYRYYTSSGADLWIATCGTGAYVGNDATGSFTQIRSNLTTGKRCNFVVYQNLLTASNGYDPIWVYDADTTNNVTWQLGACKALATTTAGSMGAGTYYYSVTIGSADNWVCGAVSNTVTQVANKAVALSNIPLGPPGTPARKLYRTAANGSSLLYLATISDNVTTTYTDTIADGSLGAAIPAITDAMPKGALLTLERERLFVSGDPSNPNYIYYSATYLPHYIQQTTQLTYMAIDNNDGDAITGIPIQLGVMVCIKRNTVRQLNITSPVSGADPTTWYANDPLAWIGSPAPYSVVQTPSGVVFLGYDHWYIFDGASVQPIIDEFDVSNILPAAFNDTVAYYNDGILVAAYTDATSVSQYHNRIMRWNFRRQALAIDTWTSSTLTGANCFAGRIGDNEPGDLFYGDSVSGYVVKDQNSESTYNLITQADALAGTLTDIFIGGTTTSPTITVGANDNPTAIPNDICIFWDDPTTNPGSGWTEITGYDGNLILISQAVNPLTTDSGQPHEHLLYGAIPLWTGTTVNCGDANPGAVGSHTHLVEYDSDGSTPLPRCVFLRLFKKNSNTTEYQFPMGSIIMYDQIAAPTGWLSLQSEGFTGYYVALNQAGEEYAFAVANITTWPAVGATYTNNSSVFTITFSPVSGTEGIIYATSSSGDPAVSGNLTNTSGTGDASIAFSAWTSQEVTLNTVNPSTHTHTFNIPTGSAAGQLANSDVGTNCPAFGHDHTVAGVLPSVDMDTYSSQPWEVPNVGLNFIKLIGPTSSWDGYSRYAYCLFAGTEAMSNGWTDVTSNFTGDVYAFTASLATSGIVVWPAAGDTYTNNNNTYIITYSPLAGTAGIMTATCTAGTPLASGNLIQTFSSVSAATSIAYSAFSLPGMYLKIAPTSYTNTAGQVIAVSTLPITGGQQNATHIHTQQIYTTSYENAFWGNNGYRATCYAAPHTHQVPLTVEASNAGNPPSLSFRLGQKILGQMSVYNDAILNQYTSGTYISAPQNINASKMDRLYWNQQITGPNDTINFYVRYGATQAACTSAAWSSAYTNPNGSDISSIAGATWFQYKIAFTCTDSRVTNPSVYFTDGYTVQYTYYQGAVNAETSVNFIYSIGFRNLDTPTSDKIYKKISTTHVGSAGSFTLGWATENSNDSMVVSLASNPEYWDSYFQANAMGKQIDITISQNDLNNLKIKQIELFYSAMQVVI